MTEVGEQAALDLLTKGWDGFLAGHGRALLEAALPAWLGQQRWFGAKTRSLRAVRLAQWVELPAALAPILPVRQVPSASTLGHVLLLVQAEYEDGSADRYQVPMAFASGASARELRATLPKSVVLVVETPTGEAVFHDATVGEEFRQALLGVIEQESALPVEDGVSASGHMAATLVAAHESRPLHEVLPVETAQIAGEIIALESIETREVAPQFLGHMPGAIADADATAPKHGETGTALTGVRSAAFAATRGVGSLTARLSSAEQSNTNVIYGKRMILKVFRRLQAGLNPDVEIGRFLTGVAHFPRIAPFLGEIVLRENDGPETTLAMLQGLVLNEGDGWEWTLAKLAGFYQAASGKGLLQTAEAPYSDADYLPAAALLGRRTAEMHLALATATDDPAFALETFSADDLERDATRIEAQINAALDALKARTASLHGEIAAQAAQVLAQRADLLRRADAVRQARAAGARIRIHGDYHLGQTLRSDGDFVLLDFEGEPARTLEERRRKQSPLKDVAGMLRSFSYAAYAGLEAAEPGSRETLLPWAKAWEAASCGAFQESYLKAISVQPSLLPGAAETEALLSAYLLEKALYELLYELNNRPAWVGIPLAGILALRGQAVG